MSPNANISGIHDEILADMRSMRQALGQRFYWFCHVTLLDSVGSIRETGLVPKADKDSSPPDVVRHYIGGTASERICLSPFGAKSVGPPVQEGTKVCLAIAHEALPARLGLDWSFDGGLGIASVLRHEAPCRNAASIFVEAADRWGSIVVYDPIPSEAIKAFAKGCAPHDLSRWPLLVDTMDEFLVTF